MPFGLLSYSGTNNIGDEIQSYAAQQLIPAPRYFLDRDKLDIEGDALEGFASVVMNGWYGQFPEHWPPSDKIRPLLISMHISQEEVSTNCGIRPHEYMLAPSLRKYMQLHGPVGARDLATLRHLQHAGIDSYFSGCLTLTLDRPDVARCDDLIVLSDVPQELVAAVRGMARKSLFSVSHINYRVNDIAERMHRARELLELYARASCVVTARLHCALPCLAMGTPVLFINIAADAYRFEGLLDMLHVATPGEILNGPLAYDISAPPPNKTLHLPYREAMRQRVQEFVAGDATYTHEPNALHPTQADRDAAIAYGQSGGDLIYLRAIQATYLKRWPVHSGKLPAHEKIPVQPGMCVAARGIGPVRRGAHAMIKNPALDGKAAPPGAWYVWPDHWQDAEAPG